MRLGSLLLLLVGAQGGGEQKSIETPKVASLREEQAKRDAVWKPVRHPAAPHFGPASRALTDLPAARWTCRRSRSWRSCGESSAPV